jgi:hypothetical protein
MKERSTWVHFLLSYFLLPFSFSLSGPLLSLFSTFYFSFFPVRHSSFLSFSFLFRCSRQRVVKRIERVRVETYPLEDPFPLDNPIKQREMHIYIYIYIYMKRRGKKSPFSFLQKTER